MGGDFEAAGDALTGGVLSRAVEPSHGADAIGSDGLTHEHACLNCGATLLGAYCHACGQHAHVHRTLGAIGHDIAHGVFHFEGKVWRTLPMLAWRPGDLTRRYIHGERARFVSPLALFLFSVFLMFAVFESVGGPLVPSSGSVEALTKPTDFAREQKKEEARIVQLEAARATAIAERKPTTAIDKRLEESRDDLNALRGAQQLFTGQGEGFDVSRLGIHTGSQESDARVREALKNPKLLIYKLQNSAYKFAWALIPLSLPFMWLMFAWRLRFKLYDHAIFVTYSLCAVMLLLIAMALLAAVGVSVEWALFLIPVHFFLQMKGAYSLGVFGALWRAFALTIMAPVALSFFATGLLLLGLLG